MDDLAIDLFIVVVLIFFLEDVVIFIDVCFVGEVGFFGEIWIVNWVE